MSTTLKIKVTKEILEKSRMCGGDDTKNKIGMNCAISLAVRDIFPDVWVGDMDIRFGRWDEDHFDVNDKITYIGLPYRVQMFIKEFDKTSPANRLLMPEIEFEIEIPDAVIETINIDELKPLLVNHPTLELIS